MTERPPIRDLPVHLIAGGLGSGKTTLIRDLIRATPEVRWAVLVNEMGDIGFDGAWLADTGAAVEQVAGGCMGCIGQVTLRVTLNRLLRRVRPQRLLIEPSGLGHPDELLAVLRDPVYDGVLALQPVLALLDARSLERDGPWRSALAVADRLLPTHEQAWSEGDLRRFRQVRDGWLAGRPGRQVLTSEQARQLSAWAGQAGPAPWAVPRPVSSLRAWSQVLVSPVSPVLLQRWLEGFPWERIKGELDDGRQGWRINGVPGSVRITPMPRPAQAALTLFADTRPHWEALV